MFSLEGAYNVILLLTTVFVEPRCTKRLLAFSGINSILFGAGAALHAVAGAFAVVWLVGA
jgi:uncharacterized membrane protein HdeD (DUF308 family)